MLIILLLSLFVPPCFAAEHIKIGAILPMSGELANLGKRLRDGISLAFEEKGDGFGITFEDATLSRQNAVTVFRKFRSVDQIRFIIGPFGPDQTLVIAPEAEKFQVMLLAVSLCEPRLAKFKNVFCLFPAAREQIEPLLVMLDIPEIAKIAYLGEELRGFEEYHRQVRDAAKARKKQLVLDRTFASHETDFRPVLTRLRSTGVDLLIIGGLNIRAVGTAFRQARELDLRPAARWFLAEHDRQFIAENQKLLDGAYSLAIPRLTETFRERFQKRYGYEPDLYSALLYDGTRALLEGIRRAGDAEKIEDVTAEMLQKPLVDGATERFSFTLGRAVQTDVAVTRIRGGGIEFVEGKRIDGKRAAESGS